MRLIFVALIAICGSVLAAQTVNIFGGLQPSGGPVATSSTDNHVLSFAVYRGTGDPATNITAMQISMLGTIIQANWTDVKLYEDTNTNGQFNLGVDTLVSSYNTVLSGKVVFNSLSIAVPEGFTNAKAYFLTMDVGGSGVGETIQMELLAADVTLSAGSTATGTSGQSNTFTLKVDTGTEIDVSYSGTSIPSSLATAHDVGYVQPYVSSPPAGGADLTFRIDNTSATAALTITSIQVSNVVNGTATVIGTPPTNVATTSFATFQVQVRPSVPSTFSFLITIVNSDFDEDPYYAAIYGTGIPQPKIELEYSSSPVAHMGIIDEGSQTAAVNQTMTFTIINAGSAALDLTGIPLTIANDGPNVTASVTTQASISTIPVSGSTTFVVTYSPIGSGSWGFNVEIPSNDPVTNNFVINVSGTAPAVTATEMRLVTQPGTALAGQAFGTLPVIAATNSAGAVDGSNNTLSVTVTITAATGDPGAALIGTTTRTASNGYIVFTGLGIDTEANGYSLTFTDDTATWTAVISNTFNVGPAPPAPPSSGGGGGEEEEGGCTSASGSGSWLIVLMVLAASALLYTRRDRVLV
ncbi:MAG: hypothetical protein ACYTDT_06970 [Planctomycetota bacterium]|jgi:hypothetical protein